MYVGSFQASIKTLQFFHHDVLNIWDLVFNKGTKIIVITLIIAKTSKTDDHGINR